MDGLYQSVEESEEVISELEDLTIKTTQPKKRDNFFLMNRASGTCRIVTKDIPFMLLESQEEENEDMAEKVLGKIMAENSPDLAKDAN